MSLPLHGKPDFHELNQILAYVAAALSLSSNTLLLTFYLSIPEVRTFFVKLLFYLSICDWFAALSIFFINTNDTDILCYIQAGFQQFFTTTAFFWMAAVSFTMYMTVCKHHQTMWKYEIAYHCLIYPIPIITTCTIFIAHNYDPIQNDGICNTYILNLYICILCKDLSIFIIKNGMYIIS